MMYVLNDSSWCPGRVSLSESVFPAVPLAIDPVFVGSDHGSFRGANPTLAPRSRSLFLSPTFALATSAICSPRAATLPPSALPFKRGPHPLLASSAPESTFPLRPSRNIAPQRPLTTTFLTNLRCPFYLELRRPRSESRGASPSPLNRQRESPRSRNFRTKSSPAYCPPELPG